MVKPRGEINRVGFSPALVAALEIEQVEIAAWCRDNDAQLPPEQVHLILHVQGVNIPLLLRFKSPDTLGFLIEELADYRRVVWPAAEPLQIQEDQS